MTRVTNRIENRKISTVEKILGTRDSIRIEDSSFYFCYEIEITGFYNIENRSGVYNNGKSKSSNLSSAMIFNEGIK